MLSMTRTRAILKLAIPMTIALASSLIMVLVDLAMVGQLGSSALAAIGLAGFGSTLVFALVAGAAPAVQGTVARKKGEGSTEPACVPLNGGLKMVLTIGLPLTLLGYFIAPYFFALVSNDETVIAEGVPYLRAMFCAITAVGMNTAFKGFWNGMARPKIYMITTVGINLLNVFLNYTFIFGNFGAPALGTLGAGVASAASLFVGSIIYFVVTFKQFRQEGFLSAKPEKDAVGRLFKLGVPATMQEFFFSAGYIVFFWMVGQVGTTDLAAANVLVRTTMVLVLFAMALGMTSATLVSTEVGKGNIDQAVSWGWDCAKVGVIWITLLASPILFFPEAYLSLFFVDSAAIDLAIIPLQLVAATTGLGSLIYVFSYTLYALGDGKRVVKVSFSTQWFIFLPAVYVIGPVMGYGLLPIWIAQMIYGMAATCLIVAIWHSGQWKNSEKAKALFGSKQDTVTADAEQGQKQKQKQKQKQEQQVEA